MRSLINAASVLILLLGAGCAGTQTSEPTPTPLPAPPETTYIVTRGELIQQITFTGFIQPVFTAEAAFKADGRIRSVYVEANQMVSEGTLLADLNILDDLQAELDRLRQQAVDESAANSEILRRALIHHEIAQLKFQLAQEQGLSRAEIRIAELQLELAELDLEDVKGSLTENDLTARIAELETAIENAYLYAPVSGELLTALAPGKAVRAHSPVALIGDLSDVELVVSPSDEQMKSLQEGMPVAVAFQNNLLNMLSGSIRELPYPFGSGPAANSGRGTMRITLEVSPEAGGYKLGDSAQVTVVLAERSDTLWLPPHAVRSVAGRKFVLVRTASGIQRIDIITGIANREQVEIVDGLSEGQVVIVP